MWPHWINFFLGLWLLLSPWMFGYRAPSHHLIGALIAVNALVGLGVRGFRYANVSLGLLLLAQPLLARHPQPLWAFNQVLVGALVLATATIESARRPGAHALS